MIFLVATFTWAPAAPQVTMTSIKGEKVTTAGLRGRVVLVNFWATDCVICVKEMPDMVRTYDRYRDRGLEIVGVSVQETSPDDVEAYAERYDLPYTIGFDGSGHIFHTYKVYALPTQFFLDTDGVVRQVVNGPVDEAGAAALIESMLPSIGTSAAPSASPSSAP